MQPIFRNIYIGTNAVTALEMIRKDVPIQNIGIEFTSDLTLLNNLYHELGTTIRKIKYRFHFIFQDGAQLDQISIEILGRFFFLIGYSYINYNSPLLIIKENDKSFSFKKLKVWCCRQGFDSLDVRSIVCFSSLHNAKDDFAFVLINSRESFSSFFFSKFFNLKLLFQPTIIIARNFSETKLIIADLEMGIAKLKKDNSELYEVILKITALLEKEENSKVKLVFLQEENANLRTFYNTLKKSNEVEHILKFYHTQYELLPLWYKRFGHVIKILMGKRKFFFMSNKERS